MKIGIDTFGCDHARSGIGTYLLAFASNLPSDSDIEVEFFGSEIDRYTYTSGKDIKFQSVPVQDSLAAQRFWHFTKLNNFVQAQKYDAVIYPAPHKVLPIDFKTPGIAVVNSILSLRIEGKRDWIQKLQIKRGLYNIPKIIAPTNFIKTDLIKHGISDEKIEVVHNGLDHKLFYGSLQMDSDIVDIKPFAIKKPYFIYCSRLSGPEKKHIELIKAFSIFKQKTNLPHRLVLAGLDGPYSSEVHKAALASSFASDIFLTGYFPYESLPQLYAGSEACIFPSTAEGVGLPVLEAMACGIPVLCSSSCALPEVGGNAAIYFDPDNVEDMANCIEEVVCDADLKQTMVRNGIEWANTFNWENTVKETLEIIKSLVNK